VVVAAATAAAVVAADAGTRLPEERCFERRL
jgi:hypothetical protein